MSRALERRGPLHFISFVPQLPVDGTRVGLLCTPVHSITCCIEGGGEGGAGAACRPAGDVREGNESGAPHYHNIYEVP